MNFTDFRKLRDQIKAADDAMQGDERGNNARPPTGDDYNALHWLVTLALNKLDAQHFYTLAEVRNGTGWPKDARFMLVQEAKS